MNVDHLHIKIYVQDSEISTFNTHFNVSNTYEVLQSETTHLSLSLSLSLHYIFYHTYRWTVVCDLSDMGGYSSILFLQNPKKSTPQKTQRISAMSASVSTLSLSCFSSLSLSLHTHTRVFFSTHTYRTLDEARNDLDLSSSLQIRPSNQKKSTKLDRFSRGVGVSALSLSLS